ncbi:MAG: 50S ribosomal protein L6 [Patescibacteria group bacterium]|nr:50S ribosomal protein L6 [Patescibacteria group bacterium]
MSKIGRMPIEIKEGVNITVENGRVKVSGSKGELSFVLPKQIEVKTPSTSSGQGENNKIIVSPKSDDKNLRPVFGLTRAQIANMVKGVTDGFEKKLELSGVGYRAQTTGDELVLSLGFSHPVKIKATPGIKFAVAENVITVSGIDKTLVGDIAAKIRKVRQPDPYKAKGVSYQGERIRRKAGKATKAVGGALGGK